MRGVLSLLRGGKSSSHPSQKRSAKRSFFFCPSGPRFWGSLPSEPSPRPSPVLPHREREKDTAPRSENLAFLPLLPVREGGRGREKRAGVMRAYPPSTAFLKSAPGPGSGPIQVPRTASEVALPSTVPFDLPLTWTSVPLPGT